MVLDGVILSSLIGVVDFPCFFRLIHVSLDGSFIEV